MNVVFGTAHLQTLKDLQELAEKHNCEIHFGFDGNSSTDFDCELLSKNNIEDKVIKILESQTGLGISDVCCSNDKIWFELLDKNTGKYSTLSYCENYMYFTFTDEYLDEEERDVVEDFIYEELNEYYGSKYYGKFSYCPTVIYGFGNKEKIEDFRVYRSGMALKFFGDLVCKYLKEPNIERVY